MKKTRRCLYVFAIMLLICSIFTVYTAAVTAIPVDTDVDQEVEGEDIPKDDESTDTIAQITPPELSVPSALLMEATTGKVLFSKDAETALPPASVTKIMTLLLVMEGLQSGLVKLDDMVPISSYASSMGGSQVFLAEGEQMTLEDLLKCTVIASANDAAVALSECISGSEDAFVAKMNQRALELGATTAHFENVTGLDDDTTNHVMSAMDIALISRELIKHKKILEYSSVWMDSIRNGEFTLTNTNRLIRYYDGATGLKTGSTAKAKFCITATAERNGMPLIAVIMGAESRDARNAAAKTLLDWGYANYGLYADLGKDYDTVPVLCGKKDTLATYANTFYTVLPKAEISSVEKQISYVESVSTPLSEGAEVGTITYLVSGEVIGTMPILASESVEKLGFWGLVGRMMKIFLLS